jgi:hypothetical protein
MWNRAMWNRRTLGLAFLLCLLCLLACGAAAAATTVYRCTTARGQVVFQDTPCPAAQRQHVLALPEVPAVAGSVLPAAPPADREQAEADAPASPLPSAAPVAPLPVMVAPLPVLYACTRATDGQTYLSRKGDPAPYLAPFGMLGAQQMPLSDVYGTTRGKAGMSAPESNRGRVTSTLVANNYVWVQDRCRELTPEETCRALDDADDENARKLRRAFKSDRAPLERRDAELKAQLLNCQG